MVVGYKNGWGQNLVEGNAPKLSVWAGLSTEQIFHKTSKNLGVDEFNNTSNQILQDFYLDNLN